MSDCLLSGAVSHSKDHQSITQCAKLPDVWDIASISTEDLGEEEFRRLIYSYELIVRLREIGQFLVASSRPFKTPPLWHRLESSVTGQGQNEREMIATIKGFHHLRPEVYSCIRKIREQVQKRERGSLNVEVRERICV